MTTVGIFFGGPSGEHEVSVHTAGTVWTSLAGLNLELTGIYMAPDRSLYYFDDSHVTPATFDSATLDTGSMTEVCIKLSSKRMTLIPVGRPGSSARVVDVVFPVIQGTLGEDGSIQGLCAMFDIACAGPTVLGASLSQDKVLSKDVLRSHGVPSCRHVVVGAAFSLDHIARILGDGPYVVKPRAQGSSLGVSYAESARQLPPGIAAALEYGGHCIVEEYVEGIEVHCYAFESEGNTLISRVSGTKSPEKIYSHAQKMRAPLNTRRFVASDFSEQTVRQVREVTERVYHLLAGKGLARLDYFLTPDGRLLFNEINSIPSGLGPVTGANPWADYNLTRVDIIRKLLEDVWTLPASRNI
jgi:D-alanine-D-alanine ligase